MSGLIDHVIPQVYSSVPSPAELKPKVVNVKPATKLLSNPHMPVVHASKATTIHNGFKKPATPPHYGWLLPRGF